MSEERRLQPGTEIRVKAILFDNDGTLVDSTPAVERVWARWADKHGVDLHELIKVSHGVRAIDTMRKFTPEGTDLQVEVDWLTDAEMRETEGVVAVPGARELVASLPADRWGVVTSGTVPLASMRLSLGGLPVPPPVFITAELVREGKPDPACYALGIERLGFKPEETLVVEDAPAGIESGRRAGARVLALATTYDHNRLVADWLPDLSTLRYEGMDAEGWLILRVVDQK